MADTLVNTLYPPMLDTFQPAFVYTDDALVSFSLSPFNAGSDINYIHISIVDQRNNENVLVGRREFVYQDQNDNNIWKTQDYGIINGILILPFKAKQSSTKEHLIDYNPAKDIYTLHISPDFLRKKDEIVKTTTVIDEETQEQTSISNKHKYYNIGQYYKVQIRFDGGYFEQTIGSSIKTVAKSIKDEADNADELTTQLDNYMVNGRPYFSEWSEITLIKPILPLLAVFTKFDTLNLETNEVVSEEIDVQKGLVRVAARVSFEDTSEVMQQLKDSGNINGLWDENEHLERYKIRVYELNDNDEPKLETVKDSGIIYTKPTKIGLEENYEYGINYLLDMNDGYAEQRYLLLVDIWSNNEYHKILERRFRIEEFGNELSEEEQPRWNNRKEAKYRSGVNKRHIEVNQEDGIAKINFKWEWRTHPTGTVHIRRGCSKDNYKKWDLIYQFKVTQGQSMECSFEDYTICSLHRYKYTAQFEPEDITEESWSQVYESAEIYPKFYEMLLERQNRQIAIRYDGKITSLKPVVNRQKIDTLGGKYPKFVENAQMNYKQLQIQGIISTEGDHNRKFLNEFDGEWELVREQTSTGTVNYQWHYKDYYFGDIKKYNDEFNTNYLVRNDTNPDGEFGYNPKELYGKEKNGEEEEESITSYAGNRYLKEDLYISEDRRPYYATGYFDDSQYSKSVFYDANDRGDSNYYQHDSYPTNHWYWERVFKEELTSWLNDGEPKLFRSMPEGNIAVMLTDITLTPNQNDRKLYNFSATMYEVGDGYSLESLDKLGIIDIPKVMTEYQDPENGNINIDDNEFNIEYKKKVFQIYYPKIATNSNNIITGLIGNDAFNKNAVQWEEITLTDKNIHKYALGTPNQDYDFELHHIRDLKIQFSSPPHLYLENGGNLEEIDDWTPDQLAAWEEENNNSPIIYTGYKIRLGHAEGSLEQTFFVNDRGYFQTPSDTLITEITPTNKDDKFIVDGIFEYLENYSPKTIVKKKKVLRKILGQWGGSLPVNSYIGNSIYDKYKQNTYDVNGKVTVSQELEYWQGVSLDVTPYAYIGIRYEGTDSYQRMLVGRTGVLSLIDDTPVKDITFLGKRMFQVDPSRAKYLDDWEFVIDKDSEIPDEEKLTWTNILDDNIVEENYADVIIYYYDDSIPIGSTTDIFKEWLRINDPSGEIPTNFPTEPQKNTVYSFIIDEEPVTMIYYLDGRWYPIGVASDQGIALAAVPVYGYVNYIGNIVRSVWN